MVKPLKAKGMSSSTQLNGEALEGMLKHSLQRGKGQCTEDRWLPGEQESETRKGDGGVVGKSLLGFVINIGKPFLF